MNEQDYQNDLLHAEDGVDEPKAAGDKCTSPGCNGVLLFDAGSPPAHDEPSTEPCIYCPDCDGAYAVDWTRTHRIEAA